MKKLVITSLLFAGLFSTAQSYQLINGGFEDIYGTQTTTVPNYEGFKQNNLGPSWYTITGSPRSEPSGFSQVNAPTGNRFAHAYHKITHTGKWNRDGQTFFMYYPMKQGATYTVSFKMLTKGTFDHLYIMATNDAQPNHNISLSSSQKMDQNLNNSVNTIFPYTDIQVVKNITSPSTNTWSTVTFTFVPTKNYTQLVFAPYIDIPTSNWTMRNMDLFLDDVTIESNGNPSLVGPSNVGMALNGLSADTNIGIFTCSGEPVILDATGTVDTYLPFNYFIEIHKRDANGNTSQWVNNWYSGLPSDAPINLSQVYNTLGGHNFTAPEGTTVEYRVKLAINSGASNGWLEKTMRIIVKGGPSFNFGVNLINQPGHPTTRKVKGLPAGSYTYKWYEGTTTTGTVISTANQIGIVKSQNGVYPYTVVVTDINTGCSTAKTTNVIYQNTVVLDPKDDLGFGKTDANNLEGKDSFVIYPNPASSVLNIQSKNNFDTVAIYNLQGKKVITSKDRSITISALNDGVYFIKIYKEGEMISSNKFVKQ
jgi:hypothetical protein